MVWVPMNDKVPWQTSVVWVPMNDKVPWQTSVVWVPMNDKAFYTYTSSAFFLAALPGGFTAETAHTMVGPSA